MGESKSRGRTFLDRPRSPPGVPLPYDVLKTIPNRIVNEARGVNRVVYDITSKPPGTMESE